MNVVSFEAPIGRLILEEDQGALSCVRLAAFDDVKQSVVPSALLLNAQKQLEAYFEGRLFCFDLPLCFRGTPFQKDVWRALCHVPYGQTICYETLAARCGNSRACRAVGMANHKNPLLIVVPCHRVVGKNGALTGYAMGLKVKKYLLELEQKYGF